MQLDGQVLAQMGSSVLEKVRKLNLDPREFIVVPVLLFLDATNISGNSSHSLEPLMMTLGILKRQLCNDPRPWKTVGYVEEMSLILGSSNLTPAEKLEDYHVFVPCGDDELLIPIANKTGRIKKYSFANLPQIIIFLPS